MDISYDHDQTCVKFEAAEDKIRQIIIEGLSLQA
jgi:hypothetical protein